MEVWPLPLAGVLLVEGTRHFGDEFWIKSVRHREGDTALSRCFPGQLLRVHGGCNNPNAFLLNLRYTGVSLKLLQAEVSPMSTIENDNTPFAREIIGEDDFLSTNLVHLQAREHLSCVEKIVVHFGHFTFLP